MEMRDFKVKLDLQSIVTSLELHGRLNPTHKIQHPGWVVGLIVTLRYFADPIPKMYGLTTFSLIAYLTIFLLFGIRYLQNTDLGLRLVNNS